MKYFFYCFKHYFDFKGRARRKEFWFFALFNFIISLALTLGWYIPMMNYILNNMDPEEFSDSSTMSVALMAQIISNPCYILSMIYSLAAFIPSLAVSVRRLHDTGHSGYWLILYYCVTFFCSFFLGISSVTGANGFFELIIGLLIIAVAILFLIWYVSNSEYGPNEYGPNPKGEGNVIEEDTSAESHIAEIPSSNE